MKKIILILIALLFNFNVFSQKLFIGLESGFTKSIFLISNAHNFIKSSCFTIPRNVNLQISYLFNNNIFISSGIAYNVYTDKLELKTKLSDIKIFNYSSKSNNIYKSIYLPISLGYKLKIVQNLYLKILSGLDFLFIIDNYEGIRNNGKIKKDIEYNFIYDKNSYTGRFNILLIQKLTLSYEIKARVYLDLFAEYHAGLMKIIDNTGKINILNEDNSITSYNPVIISNGSYWRIGFGIGYIFKKKTRKH